MQRIKTHDGVFLHNFFKDHLEYFTKDQPRVYDIFWWNYCTATEEWLPIKNYMDTWDQIPPFMKKDLVTLFDLAEQFFYEMILDDPPKESILKMGEIWSKIRNLAVCQQPRKTTHLAAA